MWKSLFFVFIIHIFTLAVGHFNHSNVKLRFGWLKYIFNNPQMHIWHHAYELPKDKPHGVNFGLTLSVWDYLFSTNYIPYEGRDIKLGFPGVEKFPKGFFRQSLHGITTGKGRIRVGQNTVQQRIDAVQQLSTELVSYKNPDQIAEE